MDTSRSSVRFLVFSASLRSESHNSRLASLAAAVVEEKGATVDRASMQEFESPFYDGDVEASLGIPDGARRFRDRLITADAYIIASPEYNASMPAVLKNAIDWVSRFRPQPLKGKRGLLMSASPSMVGGNRGLWALRVPLEHLGSHVYPDMFSLAQSHQAFTESGRLKDSTLQKYFESTIDCFIEGVEATKHFPAMKTQWIEFLGEHPTRATTRVEESEAPKAA
jgi:chromate reductase, NAD(P)H dehydrogenase (quinone)